MLNRSWTSAYYPKRDAESRVFIPVKTGHNQFDIDRQSLIFGVLIVLDRAHDSSMSPISLSVMKRYLNIDIVKAISKTLRRKSEWLTNG